MSENLGVIVLAAGMGTRMKSRLHKVLHPICGMPMGEHVIQAARALKPRTIVVVVGHQAEEVRAAFAAADVTFVNQTELNGTADAVKRCEDALSGCDEVMVLNGDCPLVTPELLTSLRTVRLLRPLSFVSSFVEEPGRLGRVVRDDNGDPVEIVEAADFHGADGPAEINAGQYVFDASWLWRTLPAVPVSAKGEYYLTHLVAAAAKSGTPGATTVAEPLEILGVDDRLRLSEAEAAMRSRILKRHMLSGVTIVDPSTTYIDAGAEIEADVTIRPNSHILGRSVVVTGADIGPATTLRNATIGRDTTVQQSVVEDSAVGARCSLGPFAHVRGGATIDDDCEIHNYAEVKNSHLGHGVKMHHFSYMGDADVGARANIAAGSITCNYDGERKHRTVIGEDAFIGCDTMLIAPVTVGARAFTATGAVVTRDVAPGETVAGVPARPFTRRSANEGAAS
ncbi:MAG: bifunctional UDP-N-acetylglucosamine diphosphorylase/glucosamine-1-phosphate N-acetyltransferase GlmU [Dehalococcoidia bacterium]